MQCLDLIVASLLNALELEITGASVDDNKLPQSAVKIDKSNELLTLTLPSELATGDHTLTLSFSGKINQQGQGLFYMRYQEQGTDAKKIALGTQFEATDARRFFPCWDEPDFKAVFAISLTIDERLAAISNSGWIVISGTSTRPLSVMRTSGMTESGMRLKPI